MMGKIKEKLSSMLALQGIVVYTQDLRVNYGYNTRFKGGCSWSAAGKLKDGKQVNVCSWDTMSKLVSHGFNLTDHGNDIELHQKSIRKGN